MAQPDQPPPLKHASAGVLDHTCFPHVLDAILLYASRPALLSFRRTSRDLRRRCDAILCSHVELHLSPTPGCWSLSCPRGERLPSLPGDLHAACLSCTRILTLRTPPSLRRMARKDLLLPALYLSARTVRLPDPFVRLSIDGLAPHAHTLVVFESVGRSFNCDKTGWFFPPTVAGTRIPPWARRYVLNVGVRLDEPELHAATWEAFAVLRKEDGEEEEEDGRRQDVVVIFRTIGARSARAIQAPLNELGLLHGLVGAIAAHPRWTWTVVGIPDLLLAAPQAAPALAGATTQDVYAMIREQLGVDQGAASFMSIDEYARARGSEARFEIEAEGIEADEM